jgi:predicted DNA-binding transcriptional regulator AlpA
MESLPQQPMTIADLCKYLQISQRSYFNLKRKDCLPPHANLAGIIRYRPCDVEKWLEERISQSANSLRLRKGLRRLRQGNVA